VKRSSMAALLVMIALGVAVATQLWAYPQFARQTKASCVTCHANVAGGAELNAAGTAFKADGKAPAASTAKAAEYVGNAKCKMCHMKQFKAWSTTQHASAWATLTNPDAKKAADVAAALKIEVKGSPSTNDACVTCHVTGFQLPGGFPQADSTKAAAVVNVTCENCHGPGSLHAAAPMAEKKKLINHAVTANMCMQCHTPVTSPKFDFTTMSKKVHPVAS
jgi:Cytochrome c554 and c-prime